MPRPSPSAVRAVLPGERRRVRSWPSLCAYPTPRRLDVKPVRTPCPSSWRQSGPRTSACTKEELLRDVVCVARSLNCPVCGLALMTTAEVAAAGVPQTHTRTEIESFEERFLLSFEPDDYGND